MGSGSDATSMMFLPRIGQDRGKHTVLRNQDDDEFIKNWGEETSIIYFISMS